MKEKNYTYRTKEEHCEICDGLGKFLENKEYVECDECNGEGIYLVKVIKIKKNKTIKSIKK